MGTKWIKIDYKNKNTLPDNDRIVLVTVDPGEFEEKEVLQAHFLREKGVWEWLQEEGTGYFSEIYGKVTHWMEYPEPARDADGEKKEEDTVKLKPCPFCGTEADHSISITDIVWTSKGDSSPRTFDGCSFTVRVFCPECGIKKTDHFVCGPLTLQIIENCCKDVFDEWNRRPSDG